MVFFTCNNCGESLKKKAVEKHNYRCRTSQGVSCVDCHKVFGDDYTSHLGCITEQEKYGGLNYTPKEMKGQKKQGNWQETLRKLTNESDIEPQFKRILSNAADCQNVPRIRKKFQNFLLSQFKMQFKKAEILTEIVFTKSASLEAQKPSLTEDKNQESADAKQEDKKRKLEDGEEVSPVQKKKKNNENGVKDKESEDLPVEGEKSKKKKKKLKHKEIEETNIPTTGSISEKPKKNCETDPVSNEKDLIGKKKKKSKKENEENKENANISNGQNSKAKSEENNLNEETSEFKWKAAIKKILKANESRMKVKKLEKIVVEDYLTSLGDRSRKLEAKELFNKKVNSDKFTIEDKYIKLNI